MSGFGPWATAIAVGVFLVFFLRYVRAITRDGRPDPVAVAAARGAAILPALLTVGVLIGELAVSLLVPGIAGWVAYGMGASALAGGIWAMERGVRAARASA